MSLPSLQNRDLYLEFLGTRGSVAVSGPEKTLFGGNTTCVRVRCSLLPPGTALFIDMGTGILEGGQQLIFKEWGGPNNLKDKVVHILATHYHWDHTIGISLSPLTFFKKLKKVIWGPVDKGRGPEDVINTVLAPPYFPVSASRVRSGFYARSISDPAGTVLLVHPIGGYHRLGLDKFEDIEEAQGQQVKFPNGQKYSLDECLVITMVVVSHPDLTVSYRFHNRKTGEVSVFCTDHENLDKNSNDFKNHCRNADLLVMDAQYTEQDYAGFASGFGHATGPYAARTALEVGARYLGLTHHSPTASDMALRTILSEARAEYRKIVQEKKGLDPNYKPSLENEHHIFLLGDYMNLGTEDPASEAIAHLQSIHNRVVANMDKTEEFITSEHLAIVGGSNQAA